MDVFYFKSGAVLMCAFLQMAIGALWYSPLLFGRVWAREIGFHEEEWKSKRMPYIETFLVNLFISFSLAELIMITGIRTFSEGMCLGFLCWFGFVATTHFSGVLWAGKKMRIYLIDISYLAISFILVGGIIAVSPW